MSLVVLYGFLRHSRQEEIGGQLKGWLEGQVRRGKAVGEILGCAAQAVQTIIKRSGRWAYEMWREGITQKKGLGVTFPEL